MLASGFSLLESRGTYRVRSMPESRQIPLVNEKLPVSEAWPRFRPRREPRSRGVAARLASAAPIDRLFGDERDERGATDRSPFCAAFIAAPYIGTLSAGCRVARISTIIAGPIIKPKGARSIARNCWFPYPEPRGFIASSRRSGMAAAPFIVLDGG